MNMEWFRELIPDGPALFVTVGLLPGDLGNNVATDGSGDSFDLDLIDLDRPLPVPVSGAVVIIARTSTDLRRAASLAALLPKATHVVLAVVQSLLNRPFGLPQVPPNWETVTEVQARRGPDGGWVVVARFTKAIPAGQVLTATVLGLHRHRPLPVQRVALAGPGASHWRPGDLDAIPSTEQGPLDDLAKIPPADVILRTVGSDATKWTDPRVRVVDRPRGDRLCWTGLGRPGALADARWILEVVSQVDSIPPVDERSVNPTGFVAHPKLGIAKLLQDGDPWTVMGGGADPVPIHPSGVVTDADVVRLRQLKGITIDWGRHTGPVAAMRTIAGLAAAGVPIYSSRVPAWAAALGGELIRVITGIGADDLNDDLRREEHSIRLRRAALRAHSARARWRGIAAAVGLPVLTPKISVLLCTKRAENIGFALAQIARQRYVDLEVVLTLHQIPINSVEVKKATEGFDMPLTVVQAPDEAVLGEVLDYGAAFAAGDYLAKWDDDDWYGPEHLSDLMLAADYTGADLVGCAHQLTYLEQINLTVFSPRGGSERYNHQVAGGTLFISRHSLKELDGFRPVPRREDSSLVRAVTAAGGSYYCTHGLGYLPRRRESGHTWDRPVTHFMRGMTHQWRGFRAGPLIIESESRDRRNTRVER